MPLSQRIDIEDILCGRATNLSWLRSQGMKSLRKSLMLAGPSRLGAVFDRLTTTRATWNGHNASGWKKDILRVNGFDERMGYGGEDRELGERLVNSGTRPYQIRHRAVCVHLEHARGYIDENSLQWNRNHRRVVRREGRTWTDYGAHQAVEMGKVEVIFTFPEVEQAPQRKAA